MVQMTPVILIKIKIYNPRLCQVRGLAWSLGVAMWMLETKDKESGLDGNTFKPKNGRKKDV